MKKLIVANWKMNPDKEARAVALARRIERDAEQHERAVETVICPPYPYLSAVRGAICRAKLGAQDVFWEERGAYTGMVSPAQLANRRVSWVIIGHSERRKHAGETDDVVHKKTTAALRVLLKPIVCVGEPAVVRKEGVTSVKRYIGTQLKGALQGIGFSVVIAYEPIWAIGTGKADQPKDSAEIAAFIKQYAQKNLSSHVRVLYGGSVKARNAGSFLRQPEIDGALIGGASIVPQEFGKIIAAASGGR